MDPVGFSPVQNHALFEAKEVSESEGEESFVPRKRVKYNSASDAYLLKCLKRDYLAYEEVGQYLKDWGKLDVFDCFSKFLDYYHMHSSSDEKCSLLQAAIKYKLPRAFPLKRFDRTSKHLDQHSF